MGCGASQPYTSSSSDPTSPIQEPEHGQPIAAAATHQPSPELSDFKAAPLPLKIADCLSKDDEVPTDLSLESVCSANHSPAKPSDVLGNQEMRMILVRHAASKGSSGGTVLDPDLTALGAQQAERLAAWLSHELYGVAPDDLFLISSPMRRCLFTVLPTVQRLGLSRESCICHGAAYEYACVGTEARGSTQADLEYELPVRCVGFGPNGWDYQGSAARETEADFVCRVQRLIRWIEQHALKSTNTSKILLLCMHETILDLIVRILVDGENIQHYDGIIKYHLKNSFMNEVARSLDGTLTVVRKNSADHMRFAVQPMIS